MIPWYLVPIAVAVTVGAFATVMILGRRGRTRADIEERRRREQEQQALMGTIATGLAHEIRNPLSTLSMNLQLLMEDWATADTDREQRSRRKVEVLLREVRRLEAVLNNFLRFAAEHRLKLEPVDVNALVAELIDFLEPAARRAAIRLETRLAPALPRIDADPGFLRQALLNLLINAQDALPEGGTITLSSRAEDSHVVLCVADDGPGIPPEHRDRVFDIYFSTKPNGTGLGLPLARKIVEEHGGTLTLAPRGDRGTTFEIRLPAIVRP